MYKFKKNFLCAGILNHILNVILGLVPRIHAKHSSLDPRVEPEDDKGMRLSNVILNHTSNVILGFIPRIHSKHSLVRRRNVHFICIRWVWVHLCGV